MTTAAAELCGHTWSTGHYRCYGRRQHECLLSTEHLICRCRCGEAVTTPTTRED